MVGALCFLSIFLIGLTSAQCPTECSPCKVFNAGEMCGPAGDQFDCGGTWNLLQPNPNPKCIQTINGEQVNVCLYKRVEDDKEYCFCDPGDSVYEPCPEIKWKGPLPLIWVPEQCTPAGSGDYSDFSLDQCKDTCEGIPGCNALNYNPVNTGVNCVLKKCGTTIPQPTGSDPPWEGYNIIQD